MAYRNSSPLKILPEGVTSERPLLFIKPERYVVRTTSWDNLLYVYLELSVTSRGEPSVAKDWRLCVATEGRPLRYSPEEIMPSDVSSFQNKTLLEDAATKAPIKRGEAVVGWLKFRLPPDVLTGSLEGGVECRDYLERVFSTVFGPAPESTADPAQPRLKVDVK